MFRVRCVSKLERCVCTGPWGGRAALGGAGSSLRGALDQRAIVAATADLLDYVMADSGTHVRHHVVQVSQHATRGKRP